MDHIENPIEDKVKVWRRRDEETTTEERIERREGE